MKRLRHALAHLFGRNRRLDVFWLLNDELMTSSRCLGCGRSGRAGKVSGRR